MGAAQVWDQLERASVARGGSAPAPNSVKAAVAATGASYMQVHRWRDAGLLGRDNRSPGSGRRRQFTDRDCEVIHALVQLSAIGVTTHWLQAATDVVQSAPVDPAGERLVVLLDGTCYRHPTDQPVKAAGPGWIVPLVSHGAHP